jgi:hypothetical protein
MFQFNAHSLRGSKLCNPRRSSSIVKWLMNLIAHICPRMTRTEQFDIGSFQRGYWLAKWLYQSPSLSLKDEADEAEYIKLEFLPWLTTQSCLWWRYVPPKRRLVFTGIQNVLKDSSKLPHWEIQIQRNLDMSDNCWRYVSFEVTASMIAHMMDFWVVTLCIFVDWYSSSVCVKTSLKTCLYHLTFVTCTLEVCSSKRRYMLTRLHGVTAQK